MTHCIASGTAHLLMDDTLHCKWHCTFIDGWHIALQVALHIYWWMTHCIASGTAHLLMDDTLHCKWHCTFIDGWHIPLQVALHIQQVTKYRFLFLKTAKNLFSRVKFLFHKDRLLYWQAILHIAYQKCAHTHHTHTQLTSGSVFITGIVVASWSSSSFITEPLSASTPVTSFPTTADVPHVSAEEPTSPFSKSMLFCKTTTLITAVPSGSLNQGFIIRAILLSIKMITPTYRFTSLQISKARKSSSFPILQ